MNLELEVGYSSHLKSLCKDVCNELDTNFSIHDAIKFCRNCQSLRVLQCPVSAKFWIYFGFICHECYIIEVFSAL